MPPEIPGLLIGDGVRQVWMSPEVARGCFLCPHLNKKRFVCKQALSHCHSKIVHKWRKEHGI